MDNSIRKNIIGNFISVMELSVSSSGHQGAGVKDLNGSLRYFSGSEFYYFNGVFNNYKNKESGVRDDLSEITDFFSKEGKPFIWWWTEESELPIEIKNELDNKGFECLGEFSGIAVKLDQVNLNGDTDAIEIKRVSSTEEYKKFIATICEVFHLSDPIKKDLEEMCKPYGPQEKLNHYIAVDGKEVIATLSSYIDEKIMGIYNGATVEKFQKKGCCSALTRKAIKEALDLNCEYAIAQLMAPGMAKGLCEKIGFKKYCRLLPFLKASRS